VTAAGPVGDSAGRVEDLAAALGSQAAAWQMRATPAGTCTERQAADAAVAAIDAMITELHRARRVLVAELRAADDAALKGDK
jgi:hypothetical protein